jgi:hypothetical protein
MNCESPNCKRIATKWLEEEKYCYFHYLMKLDEPKGEKRE